MSRRPALFAKEDAERALILLYEYNLIDKMGFELTATGVKFFPVNVASDAEPLASKSDDAVASGAFDEWKASQT